MGDQELMSEKPHILSFNEIKQAVERIEDGIIHTPLCEAKISKYMDYDIYLKCENLQYTGSCAERGIRNALVARGDEMMDRGVIVPSTGNMALGASYHGGALGIPVIVALPDCSPPVLAQRCSELGADVVLCGDTFDDAYNYAKKVHRDTKQIILSSDEPLIMAGLGTVGVEIITQLPEADAVIVPVSAGGLLASVLVACKKLKCSCLVYGAECAKVPKMMKALQAGRPMSVPVVPNLAQGLNASIVGANAFATLKGRLDRMLLVDETYIARATINMLERERLVADGAGVCSLAAVMQGLVPELRGKRAVCVISGGNIDSGRLARTIQRGLGASGRLLRFAVAVPDHRGGLEHLAKTISDEHAVLKSLVTEQMWVHSDVGATWANVVVETANEEHATSFKDRLRELYPSARFAVIDYDDKHKIGLR
ncbi:L-threonine ammonia-lyase-like [Epargyreus clarus]|uniref:L-threonine ammonia-lyase-like n=1 Tax=Epargyreus clarus TaxID=520877 RepID=UPI003C2C927C